MCLVVVEASADSDGTSVYAIGAVRRKRTFCPNARKTSRLLSEGSCLGGMEGVNALRCTDNQDVGSTDKEPRLHDTGDEVEGGF